MIAWPSPRHIRRKDTWPRRRRGFLRREPASRRVADHAVLVEIFAGLIGFRRAHHLGPDLLLLPAIEASVVRVPFAEMRRQAAPGRAGAHDPEHGFDEKAIVASVAAGIALLAGEAG